MNVKRGRRHLWSIIFTPEMVMALFFIILLSGCQYPFEFKSESEIRQEVLENDPAFLEILQKKAGLDEKIASINIEQSLHSRDIESKILALKRKQRLSREDASKRISSVNEQLDPHRTDIRQYIMELSTELKLKQTSLAAVRKMISDLNRLRGQDTVQGADPADSHRLSDKIDFHQQHAEALMQDIKDLRETIRLLRLKLKLLK